MRFVWAVVAFALAAVLIGAGIAQRTVFLGPDSAQAEIPVDDTLSYTVIDGDVFASLPGAQTLVARGEGTVYTAYGRTSDMTAWLSDAPYNAVSIDDGEIVSDVVIPEPPLEEVDPAETDAEETEESAADEAAAEEEPQYPTRNPAGSDLWLDEFAQEGSLITPLQVPADMSVLVAADGEQPAPSDLTVTWSIDNSTPWAGPLIAAGGLMVLVGLILYMLGIHHHRRSRGPRRKGPPPLPPTEPIDVAEVEAGQEKGVISSTPTTRRGALPRGKRAFTAVPVVAVSALLFAGCSADAWPELAVETSPTPTPTTTVVPEGQQAPAVTERQAASIVREVSATVAEADENLDADLAATRLAGSVLAERETNYALRDEVDDVEPLTAIPAEPIAVLLPQAYDGWPRTVMAIVRDEDDTTVAPTMMMLTQADPWANYKLTYTASMEASAELPGLAPAWLGATQVPPDSSFLILPPEELSAAYADVLDNGEDSEYYELFDPETDQFRVSVAADRDQRLDSLNETGEDTAKMTFAATAGDHAPLALATIESGAIVAVDLFETDTVRPTNDRAVIKLDDNTTVKALTGESQSEDGFTTTFSDQLFFYVPGQGSDEKIQLLGYGSNILSAKVIE